MLKLAERDEGDIVNNSSKEQQSDQLNQPKLSLGFVYLLIGIVLMLLLTYGLYLLVADQTSESEPVQAVAPVKEPHADVDSSDSLNVGPLSENPPDEQEKSATVADDLTDTSEAAVVLPDLDHSDPMVREAVRHISSGPMLDDWLSVEHLLRRFVTLVDNIRRGNIPRKQLTFLAPKGQFTVTTSTKSGIVIDPVSYQRYNAYANFLVSFDTAAAVNLYRRLKPLIDRAYQELGNSSGNFDSVLMSAIAHLRETPVLDGDVALIQPSVMYKYRDKRIENLSRAQKQLIRMGPRNTRLIQDKLAVLADALN